ncbi:hypothetical protein ACSBL2_10110 [Pedobacter sp. AW31-3R]|uniref:hypothetical protein n=1 Tax=Pedobacter sp. AW31-3R TaxID=3445781 RepID=UPI003FA08161
MIYELLIRIEQFNPSIGTYVSHTYNSKGAIVFTSTRKLKIRNAILNRQFKDPDLISEEELLQLASSN